MDKQELDLYQVEFLQLLLDALARAAEAGTALSVDIVNQVLALHREQLKAAYTNGYEDHAALGAGVVH
jgi:hypothetical protein